MSNDKEPCCTLGAFGSAYDQYCAAIKAVDSGVGELDPAHPSRMAIATMVQNAYTLVWEAHQWACSALRALDEVTKPRETMQ